MPDQPYVGLSRDVLRYERLRKRRELSEDHCRRRWRPTDHGGCEYQHRGRELRDRGKHRRESVYPKANETLLQRADEAMHALIQRLRNHPRLLQHPYALEMSLCTPVSNRIS